MSTAYKRALFIHTRRQVLSLIVPFVELVSKPARFARIKHLAVTSVYWTSNDTSDAVELGGVLTPSTSTASVVSVLAQRQGVAAGQLRVCSNPGVPSAAVYCCE